jgi:uncharacterized phage protein gp47/JayE
LTFRAEPYGVFVDDLVAGLTGGVTRERFRFVEQLKPFVLEGREQVAPGTVRIHGLAAGAYTRFRNGADYIVEAGVIVWQPLPAAVNPDDGSVFYASYELVPDPERPPRLTDRNPGSVLRTLAEAFAREYSVLSRQLEQVYDAAFLDTAEGRDLDQIVALLGLERRTQLFAVGEVVFSRTSPSPGDIVIEEGTKISTAEVPAVTVSTNETRVLRAGGLSVAVPVQAGVRGAAGVASANTLSVINRPILGINHATNPEPLAFRASTETDAALRRRAAHALEGAGRSTGRALVAALMSVEGIREQDIQIEEDHVSFPGMVKVTVAAELDPAHQEQAAQLMEETRPAGIRILHNLKVPTPPDRPASPGGGASPSGITPPTPSVSGVFSPVGVRGAVTPASASLPAADKAALVAAVEAASRDYVASKGVGEQVVYNQLVAAIMAVEGVYDVVVDLYPPGVDDGRGPVDQPPRSRQNLTPNPGTRPRLDELDITLRGALIALDISVAVERKGTAAGTDGASALSEIKTDVEARLTALLPTLPASNPITAAGLQGALVNTATYNVDDLSYTAEFMDEGLRILSPNMEITPSADQVPWVRSVQVRDSERVEPVL